MNIYNATQYQNQIQQYLQQQQQQHPEYYITDEFSKKVAWPPYYDPNIEGIENMNQMPIYQSMPPYHQQSQPMQPPPTMIKLRNDPPIEQPFQPVIASQAATAVFKGGKNMRGDLKWPPERVRQNMEEENRQRIELARGPAFRPRAIRKDYRPFFAQNALNPSYPKYRVPPGTQFIEVTERY